jgi:predicted nucleic acid-binding Zn ribbon protein
MKISNDKSLGEVIKELIETYRLEGKLSEVRVVHAWEKVVGAMIARHTKDIYISKGKLFVKLDSPALKNELLYSSSQIIENLNKEAGGEVVKEIVFI